MAFNVWVNDNNITGNIDASSPYGEGFQANSVAIAKQVNTPLRQANLITLALLNCFNVDHTSLTVASPLSDVESAIDSALAISLKGTFAAGTGTDAKKIKFKLPLGNDSDLFTVPFATEATNLTNKPTINNESNNKTSITVGGQTSDGKVIAYATNSNRSVNSDKTDSTDLTNTNWSSWDTTSVGMAWNVNQLNKFYIFYVNDGSIYSYTTNTYANFGVVYLLPPTSAAQDDYAITAQTVCGGHQVVYQIRFNRTGTTGAVIMKLYRKIDNLNFEQVGDSAAHIYWKQLR